MRKKERRMWVGGAERRETRGGGEAGRERGKEE